MRRIVLFFSLATLIGSCGNQGAQHGTESDAGAPKNSDMAQFNLKGKVQTLSESYYTADSTGNTSKQDSVMSEFSFDEKGYLLKQQQKDPAGAIKDQQDFTRNDKGSMTKMTTTKNGVATFTIMTEIADDGLTYTGGKTLDSTGKQDSYYTDLKTNEYGVVYAGKQFKMDSTPRSEWNYTFNKATYVGGSSKDSSGKVNYTGSVVLNDKGDPAEETSTTTDKDSTKTEKFIYTYGKYDEKGNWLERTATKDNKPSKVVKREIVYYKN